MPTRNPWERSWKEEVEELRRLQDLISTHKGRFEGIDRRDIANDLEACIHLLIGAQMVAMELDEKGAD
jgi:hypothetical protein